MAIADIINRAVFLIGWLLSPLTFWNDAFVNIPLAYLFANLCVWIFPGRFLLLVLIFYWMSNILGLFFMYVSGKHIVKKGRALARELVILFLTIAAYSFLLAMLDKSGILKPIL